MPDSAVPRAVADVRTISVIIPTLDEERRIGGLVRDLRRRSQAQIVVADGGSGDSTAKTAHEAGAAVIVGDRGRARQMNAGAGAATGEALIFLHADTRLPVGFERPVIKALAEEGVAGGAFQFRLDGGGRSFRFLERTTNFRSGRLGIIYGDQAIFCRADAFRRAGGFPEQPILEDYEFIRRLRRLGRVMVLKEAVVTSSRRWESAGLVKTSLLNVVVTWAYLLGVSPQRLERWYRGAAGGKRSA